MHRLFFWWLLVISLAGLSISAIYTDSPTIVFFCGLTPLIIYHLVLVLESKKGLTQVAIDSVYYFGFLVTIATLAVAVLLVSYQVKDPDWKLISRQFGLGLLATGYALFARMHLMTIVNTPEEQDPVSLAEQYVQRVKEVAERISISAVAFGDLADTILRRNREIVDSSTTAIREVSSEALKRLKADMDSATAEILQSLETLSQAMKNSDISEEITHLRRELRGLGGSTTSATTRIKTFQDSISQVDTGFLKLSQSGENFQGTIQRSISNLEKLPSASRQFLQLTETIEETCRKMESVTKQLAQFNIRASETTDSISRSYEVTASSLNRSATDAEKAVKILTDALVKMVDFIIDQTRK